MYQLKRKARVIPGVIQNRLWITLTGSERERDLGPMLHEIVILHMTLKSSSRQMLSFQAAEVRWFGSVVMYDRRDDNDAAFPDARYISALPQGTVGTFFVICKGNSLETMRTRH